jgi:hypothetical protein
MITKIDETWTQGTHIYFCNLGKTGQGGRIRITNIYEVLTEDNVKLGEIRWFGRWRCYSFFPFTDTLYEHTCLRDIADFCETVTKEHRAAKKKTL